MKSFSSLLVGWGLAQHNIYLGFAVFMIGGLIVLYEVMTAPYPDEGEE